MLFFNILIEVLFLYRSIEVPFLCMLNEVLFLYRLIEVLRDFSRTDWELASLVCQILWNYSGKITSSNDCFGQQESHDLTEILLELLGK